MSTGSSTSSSSTKITSPVWRTLDKYIYWGIPDRDRTLSRNPRATTSRRSISTKISLITPNFLPVLRVITWVLINSERKRKFSVVIFFGLEAWASDKTTSYRLNNLRMDFNLWITYHSSELFYILRGTVRELRLSPNPTPRESTIGYLFLLKSLNPARKPPHELRRWPDGHRWY